jgi:hypothetical protein
MFSRLFAPLSMCLFLVACDASLTSTQQSEPVPYTFVTDGFKDEIKLARFSRIRPDSVKSLCMFIAQWGHNTTFDWYISVQKEAQDIYDANYSEALDNIEPPRFFLIENEPQMEFMSNDRSDGHLGYIPVRLIERFLE